jgi:hypothetical protein
MTPRQQETMMRLLPILLLMLSGTVAWTQLKDDVQDLQAERVKAARFEAESIRVHNELAALRELRSAVRRIESDADLLPRICAAVKCNR